jgi:hypothetical protein
MITRSVWIFLVTFALSSADASLHHVAFGEEFGHWETGILDDKSASYAATVSDSGEVFGEFCNFASKTCNWILAVSNKCDTNDVYPVLGNTDKGAAHFEVVCLGANSDGTKYRYGFKSWQELEKLIRTGSRFGIATPMQSDQFRVFRFWLDGLNASTKSMEGPFFAAVAPDKGSGRPKTSTVSETL